jgi:hypothetical protein
VGRSNTTQAVGTRARFFRDRELAAIAAAARSVAARIAAVSELSCLAHRAQAGVLMGLSDEIIILHRESVTVSR